jgi:hypothetical protein
MLIEVWPTMTDEEVGKTSCSAFMFAVMPQSLRLD